MKTSEKILEYIKKNHQVTGVELIDYLGITDRAIRKQLKQLLEAGYLKKTGRPPRVYYSIVNQTELEIPTLPLLKLDSAATSCIEKNFYYVTPLGEVWSGVSGFYSWCSERSQDVIAMSRQYVKLQSEYDKLRKKGLIDGTAKLAITFGESALDKLLYVDFYSIEIFGKTKLGQMLLFAKQSQDRKLINEIADLVRPRVLAVINQYNIDAVGFIPPTVKRELQLMKQLEKRLNLSVQTISIIKIKTPVTVPQKTLSKLGDRTINARNTINVPGGKTYGNILLIDDAVGSGATLQETAHKIRIKGLTTGKVIGLALTGSVKGFDVISEV